MSHIVSSLWQWWCFISSLPFSEFLASEQAQWKYHSQTLLRVLKFALKAPCPGYEGAGTRWCHQPHHGTGLHLPNLPLWREHLSSSHCTDLVHAIVVVKAFPQVLLASDHLVLSPLSPLSEPSTVWFHLQYELIKTENSLFICLSICLSIWVSGCESTDTRL